MGERSEGLTGAASPRGRRRLASREDEAVISVELLLDPVSEAAVLRDWRALIEADLPSAGRHTGESNRPHITLAVRDRPRSLAISASALPVPVILGGPLLFPGREGRWVLARQIVVTAALLALHREVAEVVGDVDSPRYATTAPDRWTPHVTLAARIPTASLAAALAVVSREPVEGSAVVVRVWDAETKTVTDVDA